MWSLSAKGELLHLYGKASGFPRNTSKSKLLANLLKLKNLKDKGGASLLVTIAIENFIDDVGRDLTISGSRKMPAIFINSISLFPKNILQNFSGGDFSGGKDLYNLDSIRSNA